MKHLLLFLLLTSCAGVEQKLDPEIYYELTLKLDVNGKALKGVGVADRSDKYRITVTNPGRGPMDFLRITNCHREITKNDEGSKFTFDFYPAPELETKGSCLMRFESYDKNQKHGWGVIDFMTPEETLPAVLFCNGHKSEGPITMCQSREGLMQRIDFAEAVYHGNTKPECKIDAPTDGKSWVFTTPNRECIYAFKNANGDIHRLTTVGYEDVLIPAGE